MLATVRYVLLTALRDRLFLGLLVGGGLAAGLAGFLGDAAMVEGDQMALVFAGTAVRLILVIGLVLFVAFHVQRLYETREIEAILSRPLSREGFVIAYWFGMALLAVLLAVPLCALMVTAGAVDPAGLGLWAATVVLECLVVVAFTVFAGLTLERALFTSLVTLGFYVLSRMMSFFVAIAEFRGARNDFERFMNYCIEGLAALCPRLDLFGQTEWLAHGAGSGGIGGLAVLQTLVYVPLLLAAATFDLKRKRF